MHFVIFTHSLVSDWNHGNAHFLRGFTTELKLLGHSVRIFEPADSWSRENLLREHGEGAVAAFEDAYPLLCSERYCESTLDLDEMLQHADVVIVHEWNSHSLVKQVGDHHRQDRSYQLYFHDTHHRSATDPRSMADYDLRYYDGVLAYGNVIRDIYQQRKWVSAAWTWHEAADTIVFRPLVSNGVKDGDLVWIGNWGDEERTTELREYLIEPVKALKLKARVYGVRYPEEALIELDRAGIEYGGWLPNYKAPEVFSRYKVTVHIPRRPYAHALPGIPTIRPFEAMACGIPLISAPWQDTENLFRGGKDFLFAYSGAEMKRQLETVLSDDSVAQRLAANGLETIRARHTCGHRAEQLVKIAGGPAHVSAAGGNA